MNKKLISCLLVLSFYITGCSKNEDEYVPLTAEEGEQYSGGTSTVRNATQEAFGFASTTLTSSQQDDFGVGNSLFRLSWVSAPSSTTARDGLGPFYNATSCSNCHFKDGRGRPPAFDGEFGKGLLLRLSMPGMDAHGGSLPDPVYGHQLQDNAIIGPVVKGHIGITYQTIVETFDDGTTVNLQKPIYRIDNLGYGNLDNGVLFSPRIANQIVGLGLLEAVPQATLLSFADEFDSDGNGISGRANYVYDIESNSLKMGRFGWKANQPSVKQQVAAAFSGDLGITSYLFPNELCPPGVDCGAIPNGGSPEIPDLNFNRVVLYSQVLSVPIRRNYNDQNVLRGKQIFGELNCVACHIPKMQTGNDHVLTGMRNQTIRPYTDLLLHDMGTALADNAPDFLATGSEWRTPPLWGMGLVRVVNGHTTLMHDGRASNATEAILWHGGEAEQAKQKFKKLSAKDREDLLAFLNSL
ncbi:thiol oxidoreductase [Flavobacterium rivuli WB 3.3-2 = DSM 21788]|uniref:Thiol oxidoreductase n=1 Tax=Flavobacterium rivuli WB 3.3-2 = DSM 21788 TaxID=1121895 RepID=A0A0A2MA81_9FLAO|nr:di-heme oxidoredictase family protein [Flavobacterium rivuli]KGO85165.1 thiol oxidoreductase [Flavobacterium rivuli WB 3.3-2 = DSM 21788]